MLLIDSSIWIDYLAGTQSPSTDRLDDYLKSRETIATTGLILQEVLQGTKSERQLETVRSRLSGLTYLPASKGTHFTAARLYRRLRAKGVTVPSMDALIGAVAIENSTPLLTDDRDHFRAL